MLVTLVHVRVKPGHTKDFLEATRRNHEGSRSEPGNFRFDVLQDPKDPTRFLLYEAFRDEAAAAEHKKTAHYLAWREEVESWMAEPRRGEPWTPHFPSADSEW